MLAKDAGRRAAVRGVTIMGLALQAVSVPRMLTAQDVPTPTLFEAEILECSLGEGTQGSWEEGAVVLETGRFGADAAVTFGDIDLEAGRATIVGNVGEGEITAVATRIGITFIEDTPFGNINVTTVFSSPVDSGDVPYALVASRHHDVDGPFPSQWLGRCRIGRSASGDGMR